MPNVAASVAYRLGIVAPGAYDLNAACAGFCYVWSAPRPTRWRAGSARNALVIGAKKMTTGWTWTDRSTCIIFADGAGGGRGRGRPPTGSRTGSARSSGAAQATRAQKIVIEGRNWDL